MTSSGTGATLNWREINALLEEWPDGQFWLKKIRQPDYRRLILEFSGSGAPWAVAMVLQAPYVRIYRISDIKKLPRALPKPPRFAAVLKSRLDGARLLSCQQLGRDRIVRFHFRRGEEDLLLDAKLWGGGANLILCNTDLKIIDAFSRRPKRREAPGEIWPPDGVGDAADTPDDAGDLPEMRSLPGEGDWNRRVEVFFSAEERRKDLERRTKLWENYFLRREAALDLRKRDLDKREAEFRRQQEDGHWGDLIMSQLHRIETGEKVFEAEDWENPGTMVRLNLDPALSPRENAERYYSRKKRADRALEYLREDRRAWETAVEHVNDLREQLRAEGPTAEPLDRDPPDAKSPKESSRDSLPGLWISKSPFTIAVGRNAKESDYLLRRWAKGNDLWLHARDWPGGHVFVRAPRGKTVPLELLLDAGNLALSYSKGKNAGEADLYYTQVKNLRRAKNGKPGTVLPTREKNLRIRLDKGRLDALKAAAEIG